MKPLAKVIGRFCVLFLLTVPGAGWVSADDAPVYVVTRTVRIPANAPQGTAQFPMVGPTNYEVVSVSASAVNASTAEVFPGVTTYLSSPLIDLRATAGGGKPDAVSSPGNFVITCQRKQNLNVVVDVTVSVTLRKVSE